MLRLRELRLNSGITQKQLAEYLRIAQNTLSYWETGKYEPDSKDLAAIADYFNVSVDYLLGKTDIKNFPTESSRENRNDMEREYHELFALLTPDSRQELKAFLSLSPEQRKAILALAQANRPDKE